MNPAIALKALDFFQPQKTSHPLSKGDAALRQLLAERMNIKS
jgi:hypothetical protein